MNRPPCGGRFRDCSLEHSRAVNGDGAPKLFAAETTLAKKIRVSVCNTLSAFAYNDDESGKEVGQMACNNGLFGGNSCCTWIIILLILSMCCGGEGGLFGGNGCNNCGCGNNCGCDNSCGC